MKRLPAYTENKEIKQKNVISNSGALILRLINDTANTRATAGVPKTTGRGLNMLTE